MLLYDPFPTLPTTWLTQKQLVTAHFEVAFNLTASNKTNELVVPLHTFTLSGTVRIWIWHIAQASLIILKVLR